MFTGPITALRSAALATLSLLLVAGCAGSGYTYHSNQDERVYFKVPDDWTVFDNGDFPGGDPGPGVWVRGFVAGADPTFEDVFAIAADVPRGYVQIEELDVMERDAVSLASLRGTNFGTDMAGNPVDPLAYAQEFPDQLRILGYEDDLVYDDGPHGVHLRVAVTPQGGSATAVIDQTVLVDAATSTRYVLSLGCNAECFQAHEREIEEVIESWTLEAK